MAKKDGKQATAYRLTKKEMPKEAVGQRRAVYDAIKAGAEADAAAAHDEEGRAHRVVPQAVE